MDNALATVIRQQAGAISRRQLLEHVSERTARRWLTAGHLVRSLPGVYRHAASQAGTTNRLHSALLYAGRGAHLSHTTAAQLHGIDANTGSAIHITVPAGRTVKPQQRMVLHRSSALDGAQVIETKSRLRITSAARTLLDLSDVLARPGLDIAFSDAVRQNKVTIDYVSDQLLRSGRRRNSMVLTALMQELDPALESVLEAEFAALLSNAGIEPPSTQHEIWEGPLLVARVDFAYAERRLAIEVDGYGFHTRFDQFQRDRERRRELKRLRWEVIEFTATDIRCQPAATVDSVRQFIALAA